MKRGKELAVKGVAMNEVVEVRERKEQPSRRCSLLLASHSRPCLSLLWACRVFLSKPRLVS
jgi:hypothetical protein